MKDFSQIRTDYSKLDLIPERMNKDPLVQAKAWINDAVSSKHPEPNSMTLSTLGLNNNPHSRIVLLKEITASSFVFYTNYTSSKAKEIAKNPKVAALIFYPLLERQLRIEGIAKKVSENISDSYFSSRPRESQIGAWASPQSKAIESYNELMERYEQIKQKFQNKDVPRPPFWGGYEIIPSLIEFWQGQPGRMHQRYRYQLIGGKWLTDFLAP